MARKLESEKRQKQLVAACEKDRPGIRCQVSSFFQGGLYQLIEMLEIRDVRLVYAPARSVGDYGGEIDNWEWPRHTGDWSFFRAYVGKDGKPADYSPDNVPYQPKHHLQVSTSGLKPGDFVMVAGYPGVTNRNVTAKEVRNDVETFYPYLIAYLEERYKVAEAHLGDGGETTIKATVVKQGVQNGLEKYQGILQGIQKNPDLLAQKDALDRKAKDWAAQPGHEAVKKGIEKLEAIVGGRGAHAAGRLRPRGRLPRLGAAVDGDLADAMGRGARQEGRGPQARLSGPRHGARDGGAEAAHEAVRPHARPRDLPARARPRRALARGRPGVAGDVARRPEGNEGRRGAHRREARRLVPRGVARGREDAPRAARERDAGQARGVEGPVRPGRAAHLADLQGRGEKGRRAHGRAGAGDAALHGGAQAGARGRARAGREPAPCASRTGR